MEEHHSPAMAAQPAPMAAQPAFLNYPRPPAQGRSSFSIVDQEDILINLPVGNLVEAFS